MRFCDQSAERVNGDDVHDTLPCEDAVDASYDSLSPDHLQNLYYSMRKRPRGLFVIFNHENFKHANPRWGTEKDKNNLERVWSKIGFQVITHNDLTKNRLEIEIEKYSKMDHSKFDCFACAFLSHGDECGQIYASDGVHNLKDAIQPFQESSSLRGKPKLFFIQACRGKEMDDGKVLQSDSTPNEEECEPQRVTLPSDADILIAYSTVDGNFAWRNTQKGSWFIQSLTQCIERYYQELDLMRILTLVNREVGALESKTNDKRTSCKKQSPSVVTRLTALVHFGRDHQAPGGEFPRSMKQALPAASGGTGSVSDSAVTNRKEQYYRLKTESLKKQNAMNKVKRRKYQIEIACLLSLLFGICVFLFDATSTMLFRR